MTALEWLQLAGIGAVALGVLYVIVRWMLKESAMFPETAKKYGITFTHEKQGGLLSNVSDVRRLRGVAMGTPIEVVATYQTRGRMRMRSTVLASPALAGLPACTMNILRQPPAANVHLVPTGDAQFDAKRWVTSDTPAAVRAVITPAARTALLRCPHDELRLVIKDGHFILGLPGTPMNQAELHGLIDAVLALPRNTPRNATT
ncbi:MAG TPA: hypothetical protein VGL98_11550 [Gammaproteobacteria bacterium]